ncbi:reverse transcriptase domain-containing protein [Tanacetum coccineum]|uniref:Reverse transcriptase domain-containing protein n=1 Tax=Tanacetum coccineum TaxID=301880 RepID=A0ABQ5J6B5_9ASTR
MLNEENRLALGHSDPVVKAGPKLASSDSSQTICEYSYALWFEFLVTSTNDAELRSSTGGYGVKSTDKLAAVQFVHLSKEVLVEVLNERSVEAQEVNMVVEEEGPTWMTPIRNYLEKGILPEDLVDARTLMEKIGNYTMKAGVMYRKSYLVLLMRDARELIRACDDCQAHTSVPRLPKAYMITVTSAWPFMKWGIDIVGPLLEVPGRVKYLIVETDYFTKWMEAKPLATITATIITNNGTQFMNDSFKKWAEKLKIQLISTLIYHPHGNGVVERANRSLLRGIKTRLEKGGSAWAEEIGKPTHRTSNLNEKTNDWELRLNLNLLEEQREIAAIRETRYKQQVEKYYNKKVRHVQFKVGEFVLRKNKASRDANTGKLGPTREGPYKVIQAF